MTVTLATVDLDQLRRRHVGLQMRFAALQGQARELQSRQTELTREISLAKARQDLAPQVEEAFNFLQEKAHSRAVGEFEDLLSAFVADVVPDAGQIHLELSTERNAPALDILLDNGGDLENILEGNGGGLTNVVVTGLGFSALARTANRQLMVLDEPDCWLKAKYVPNFTKVIAEVANPRFTADGASHAGCQTLMISHNDIGLMDDGAHIQDLRMDYDLISFAHRHGLKVVYRGELSACAHVVWVSSSKSVSSGHLEVRYRQDGAGDEDQNALTKGFPYVDSISGARPWPVDMPGIRWIEVANLRRHVWSRLELSPGLNVLTGDINGGKSTLYFTALRAMAYGETDDTMIRHGADFAMVRVGLENDVVLEMVRSRKGSPKVMYRRYDNNKLVHEGRQETRGGVPSFIGNALKISRVDDLDIQLRSQKQPIFLLNESATRRAQLLSVGKESGLLQAMMERHRLNLRRDRDDLRKNESELNLLNRKLNALTPLAGMSALVSILDDMQSSVEFSSRHLGDIRQLVGKLQPLYTKFMLAQAVGELQAAPAQITLESTTALSSVISKLERTQTKAMLTDISAPPALPAIMQLTGLTNVIKQLTKGQSAASLIDVLPSPPIVPTLADTAEIKKRGVALSQKNTEIVNFLAEEKLVNGEFDQAQTQLDALKRDLGVCPVCSNSFFEAHHVH